MLNVKKPVSNLEHFPCGRTKLLWVTQNECIPYENDYIHDSSEWYFELKQMVNAKHDYYY